MMDLQGACSYIRMVEEEEEEEENVEIRCWSSATFNTPLVDSTSGECWFSICPLPGFCGCEPTVSIIGPLMVVAAYVYTWNSLPLAMQKQLGSAASHSTAVGGP